MQDKNTNNRNWADITAKPCKTERTTLPTKVTVERVTSNNVENIYVIGAEVVSAKPRRNKRTKFFKS